jgi:hypothetical protein
VPSVSLLFSIEFRAGVKISPPQVMVLGSF